MTLYNFLKIIDRQYGGLEVSDYILNYGLLCPDYIQTADELTQNLLDLKIDSKWALVAFREEPHLHKAMHFPCKIYFADTNEKIVEYTDILEQQGYLPPTTYSISACEKAYPNLK